MTVPLMALAVGAIVAGFVGIPHALGGTNEIERFLEPSFIAQPGARTEAGAPAEAAAQPEAPAAEGEAGGRTVSRVVEMGLMFLSVLIAGVGIWTAYRFYVQAPQIAEHLKERWSGAHHLLYNKYYVDELYNATVISGTMRSGRGLWTFDRKVVDGAVNGTSWVTVISSWFSGLTDRTVVDGVVNLVGWIVQESSLRFRRFQTGLVQNYALVMLFGIFAFVGIYLFVR